VADRLLGSRVRIPLGVWIVREMVSRKMLGDVEIVVGPTAGLYRRLSKVRY
jgi:hypothetical protein